MVSVQAAYDKLLATRCKTEEEVDSYVESLREKLMDRLDGHDVLHII